MAAPFALPPSQVPGPTPRFPITSGVSVPPRPTVPFSAPLPFNPSAPRPLQAGGAPVPLSAPVVPPAAALRPVTAAGTGGAAMLPAAVVHPALSFPPPVSAPGPLSARSSGMHLQPVAVGAVPPLGGTSAAALAPVAHPVPAPVAAAASSAAPHAAAGGAAGGTAGALFAGSGGAPVGGAGVGGAHAHAGPAFGGPVSGPPFPPGAAPGVPPAPTGSGQPRAPLPGGQGLPSPRPALPAVPPAPAVASSASGFFAAAPAPPAAFGAPASAAPPFAAPTPAPVALGPRPVMAPPPSTGFGHPALAAPGQALHSQAAAFPAAPGPPAGPPRPLQQQQQQSQQFGGSFGAAPTPSSVPYQQSSFGGGPPRPALAPSPGGPGGGALVPPPQQQQLVGGGFGQPPQQQQQPGGGGFGAPPPPQLQQEGFGARSLVQPPGGVAPHTLSQSGGPLVGPPTGPPTFSAAGGGGSVALQQQQPPPRGPFGPSIPGGGGGGPPLGGGGPPTLGHSGPPLGGGPPLGRTGPPQPAGPHAGGPPFGGAFQQGGARPLQPPTQQQMQQHAQQQPQAVQPPLHHHQQGPAAPAAQQTRPAQASQQRIDPSAIPRPRYTTPYAPIRFNTSGDGSHVPPPAWGDFVIEDTGAGNCNPRYMRSSLYHVPCGKDLLRESRVPLALSLSPFAQHRADLRERAVEICAGFGDAGPPRCSRCRGYLNPFVKWADSGRTWVCNLCAMSNECPESYLCGVDSYGARNDRSQRPELCLGSVEFVAPPSYLLRPVHPPVVLFVIETSQAAVASGALSCALRAVRAALEAMVQRLQEGVEGLSRAGISTYDSVLRYYDVRAPGKGGNSFGAVSVAVAVDVDDAFCPLAPAQFAPPLVDAYPQLLAVLDHIAAEAAAGARPSLGVAGAAAKAAIEGVAETSGRVVLFQSTLATAGEGKLTSRERLAVYGSDKEKELYLPAASGPGGGAGAWYAEVAKSAVSRGVAVDISVCTPNYVDVGSFAALASGTGGSVKLFPQFAAPAAAAAAAAPGQSRGPGAAPPPVPGGRPPAPAPTSAAVAPPAEPVPEELQQHLIQHVVELVSRDAAFEAVLKVRTSSGLRVSRYLGNFSERAEGEADVGVLDAESGLVALLAHDGNDIKEGEELFLQAAALFTTPAGQRRVRVHNLRVIATDSIQAVFRHADLDTVLGVLLRNGVQTVLDKEPRLVMQEMTEVAIDMLHSYRKHCAASSSPGQLILPDSLKLLPLYLAVIGKLAGFNTNKLAEAKPRPGAQPRHPFADVAVRADARIAQLVALNGLPAARIVPFVYPRLFVLHTMCGLYGTPLESDDDLKLLHWEPSEAQPTPPHRTPSPLPVAPSLLSHVILPRTTYPSAERVEPGGVFLLDHAEGLFVHVGLDAEDQVRRVRAAQQRGSAAARAGTSCLSYPHYHQVVTALFGPPHAAAAALPRGIPLPRLQTDLSLRTWAAIDALRAHRRAFAPVAVVVPADADARDRFAGLLTEDRVGANRSYVDLLCHVHTAIQARMS